MHPLLNIAVRAARRAGSTIVRSMNQLDSIKVSSKGRNDFVSEVDRAAEQEIIETVRRAYPDHAFLAEESGRLVTAFLERFFERCEELVVAEGFLHVVVRTPAHRFDRLLGGRVRRHHHRLRVLRP